MRKSALAAGMSLLVAMPFSVMAEPFNYSYLEGLYIVNGDLQISGSESETQTTSFEGWHINGSLGLTDSLFIVGEFSQRSIDDNSGLARALAQVLPDNGQSSGGGGGLLGLGGGGGGSSQSIPEGDEFKFASAGLGIHIPVGTKSQPVHVYGTLLYESIEALNKNVRLDGYSVTAGLRWAALPSVEISPYAAYFNYGEIEQTGANLDAIQLGVQALYNITPAFAVTAQYQNTKFEVYGSHELTFEFAEEVSVGIRYYFGAGSSKQ